MIKRLYVFISDGAVRKPADTTKPVPTFHHSSWTSVASVNSRSHINFTDLYHKIANLFHKLEGAQRVHISAKLHCLHPDRNFKFHLCLEIRIAYLYICVVIVAMTTQRYNLASRNSLPKHQKWCSFLYISPQPPFRS